MTPDHWNRVESLFHAALEHPQPERAAFLARECSDDAQLRAEVAALLAHDQTGGFIETPAIELAARQLAADAAADSPTVLNGRVDSDTPGEWQCHTGLLREHHTLGHFRLLRKIGEGGMGEVYLAEDLKLGRRVALKLLPESLVQDSRAARKVLREARAASALNNANIVTIHAVEEVDGHNAIVMEYIQGESLRDRLLRGPLPVEQVITIGLQIAEAIAAAHAINIVHRDLKPGNILITGDGQIKIVDFGLAKVTQGEGTTEEADSSKLRVTTDDGHSVSFSHGGAIAGTIPYMSPEQTRGEHLDGRSDIFSLGAVLYEAATGQRPFPGEDPVEVFGRIRTSAPPTPSTLQKGLPRGFDRIVMRAVNKEKHHRYANGADLAADLRRLRSSQSLRRAIHRLRIPVVVGAILVALATSWKLRHDRNLAWAKQTAAEIPPLARSERFFEAYDLTQQVAPYLPDDDPTLSEWTPFVTDVLSVTTEPPGARVLLQRFQPDEAGQHPAHELIGTTPIRNLKIARGEYLLTIEKNGFTPVRRTMSNALARWERGFWVPGELRRGELIQSSSGDFGILADSNAPIEIDLQLHPLGTVPEGMVPVPGGDYRLVGVGRTTNVVAELDEYFIDKCEVSNRRYKEFIDAGGYSNRAFWKHPFVKDGEELAWEAAMSLLRDLTNLPGPRQWTNQQFPRGQADHPVTGVTWYEAAAYAEYRGKSLPTIFQWEKAARDGESTALWGCVLPWGLTGQNPVMEGRVNFNSSGTVPVDSFPFGASVCGCLNMAGNVAEWCLNARPDGFTASSGSFREGPHHFGFYGQYPGFYSSETLGFRCVLNDPQSNGDQGGMPLDNQDRVPQYEPVSDEMYPLLKAHYNYDPLPLDARIVEDVETEDWRRLRISYIGALGQRTSDPIPEHKRALAYLWLPKNAPRPLQVIYYKPGAAVFNGITVPQETEVVCGPFLLSGRAVLVSVIEGMRDRDLPPGWKSPGVETVAYRESMYQDCVDQRIALDYLATRDEIDMDKIVCFILSAGSFDLLTTAVDGRFRGTLFLSAGINPYMEHAIAEANPANFAPRIPGPKLMIHSRYDEGIPYKTMALPLYNLLREPKRLVTLETGHFPPMSQWVPVAQAWFDEVLGPVDDATLADDLRAGR